MLVGVINNPEASQMSINGPIRIIANEPKLNKSFLFIAKSAATGNKFAIIIAIAKFEFVNTMIPCKNTVMASEPILAVIKNEAPIDKNTNPNKTPKYLKTLFLFITKSHSYWFNLAITYFSGIKHFFRCAHNISMSILVFNIDYLFNSTLNNGFGTFIARE